MPAISFSLSPYRLRIVRYTPFNRASGDHQIDIPPLKPVTNIPRRRAARRRWIRPLIVAAPWCPQCSTPHPEKVTADRCAVNRVHRATNSLEEARAVNMRCASHRLVFTLFLVELCTMRHALDPAPSEGTQVSSLNGV